MARQPSATLLSVLTSLSGEIVPPYLIAAGITKEVFHPGVLDLVPVPSSTGRPVTPTHAYAARESKSRIHPRKDRNRGSRHGRFNYYQYAVGTDTGIGGLVHKRRDVGMDIHAHGIIHNVTPTCETINMAFG